MRINEAQTKFISEVTPNQKIWHSNNRIVIKNWGGRNKPPDTKRGHALSGQSTLGQTKGQLTSWWQPFPQSQWLFPAAHNRRSRPPAVCSFGSDSWFMQYVSQIKSNNKLGTDVSSGNVHRWTNVAFVFGLSVEHFVSALRCRAVQLLVILESFFEVQIEVQKRCHFPLSNSSQMLKCRRTWRSRCTWTVRHSIRTPRAPDSHLEPRATNTSFTLS